jgi:hypothetical protein
MYRITITVEATSPLKLAQAVRILNGVITGWRVGRARGELTTRRSGSGWWWRCEDESLATTLGRSVRKPLELIK